MTWLHVPPSLSLCAGAGGSPDVTCARRTKASGGARCGGVLACAGVGEEGFELWVCLRCYDVRGRRPGPVVLFDRDEGPDA